MDWSQKHRALYRLLPADEDMLACYGYQALLVARYRAKAKDLLKTPVFNGVQAVKLPAGIRSCFWRFHTSGVAEEGVCTIEALYHLLKSLHASGGWLAKIYTGHVCKESLEVT